MSSTALHWVVGAFALVFCAIAGYGALLACVYTCQVASWLACLLIALEVAALVWFRRTETRITPRAWWRLYLMAQVAAVPCMLVFASFFLGGAGADYRQLFDIATAHLAGEEIPYLDKYGAYPNNHLLLMFMIWFFGIVRTVAPQASPQLLLWCHVVLNVMLIQASCLMVACAVRLLWGRQRGAAAGIAMVMCAPFWASCSNPYSDTGALFFVSAALLLMSLLWQTAASRKAALCALAAGIGVLCAVGFHVKATVGILAIACVMTMLVAFKPQAALPAIGSLALAAIVASAGCTTFVETARPSDLPYDDTIRFEQEFPYVHWLMMGMNPETGGKYSRDDYYYTRDAGNKDEKVAADRALLEQRLEQMGTIGTIRHVLVSKPWLQWRTGAMLDASIFDRKGALESDQMGDWDEHRSDMKAIYDTYFGYAQACHIMFLTGAALCAWKVFGKRKDIVERVRTRCDSPDTARSFMLLTCALALFGFGLFLCGIWEVKPRYILHFAPLIIVLGLDGLTALLDWHADNDAG